MDAGLAVEEFSLRLFSIIFCIMLREGEQHLHIQHEEGECMLYVTREYVTCVKVIHYTCEWNIFHV